MAATIPTTQKAVLINEIGKPVQLSTTHPVPSPGPNQVLLKVTVAGLNPHDQKVRDFGLFVNGNIPAIIANDVVGVVVALGPGVTAYQLGDRVLSHAGFSGATWGQSGLQEYAVHDVGAGFKIPDEVSDDEAALLPTNVIAPLFGLFADAPKGLGIPAPWTKEAEGFDYAGQTLLIIGGGSNCGRYAVQLAALAGIGKIVVVGGREDELKGFGATTVLDRHGGYDVVLDRIRRVVGDDLVYAFDAVSPPEEQLLGLNALSSTKKGRFARLLPRPLDETKVVGKKAGFELISVFGSSQQIPGLAYAFWERVPEFLRNGGIKKTKFEVKKGLLAENVNEVLDRYRDGVPVTKTHIHL